MIPPECLVSCFPERRFPSVALHLIQGPEGLCKTLFKAWGAREGVFSASPVFYCLDPQLELVGWFSAESFNGEHLLPCSLVQQAAEICGQWGVAGWGD